MPLFSNLIGFFTALFCLLGAFSLGWQTTKFVSGKHTSFHISFAIGLGIIYCSTFIFFLIPYKAFVWVLIAIFFFSIGATLPKIFQLLKQTIDTNWRFWLGISLLLCPLFFRVLSPPTSFDGMSFYLPNVAWISQNGLRFNSHLPQYSTMPLLTELFFALSYKLGGIQSVRFSDVLFSLLLLDVLFKIGESFNNKLLLCLFIAINLLVPGCIIYVFGTGKVDTLGFYLVALGSYYVFCKWHPMRAYFYFSVALAVKYTLWVILVGPLLGLGVLMFLKKCLPWPKNVLVLSLPLLFAGPVLVKNHYQVNNPFAPLLPNGKETRYVGSHGELPESAATEITSAAFVGISTRKIFKVQLPNLKTFVFFPFAFFLFSLYFFHNYKEFWRDLLFWSLFTVLWLYLFGNTSQPLRFFWPIFFTAFIFLFKWSSLIFSKEVLIKWSGLSKISIVLLWLVVGGFFWLKNGNWIPNFLAAHTMPISAWYHHNNRNHYAISAALAKGPIPINKICFEERLALGFFSLEDWQFIPQPQAFLHPRTCQQEKSTKYIYGDRESIRCAPPEKVIFQFGEFVFYQPQKECD